MAALRILVSAGEASGDLYAASLVRALQARFPQAEFFGCTGPRMREAGVETIVDAAQLAVVGLVEVVAHIPRIYGEFRRLCRAAEERKPELAILTDSPDFHLRVARRLHRQGVPVFYLVAPQVWAWRKGRLPLMRRVLQQIFCIFPFEELFFRRHGVKATYIGHPLTRLVRATCSRAEFLERHHLPDDRPLLVLLPGSRRGEVGRHWKPLREAVARVQAQLPCHAVWATPKGFVARAGDDFFRERIASSTIQVIEGDTWNAISAADIALAASGTVTVETALLGTPMITYYRVTGVSWLLGRLLVDVPYYSMVNLVAGRRIVPELMQAAMTGERLAEETLQLLRDEPRRQQMQQELAAVADQLATGQDPLERAAQLLEQWMERKRA